LSHVIFIFSGCNAQIGIDEKVEKCLSRYADLSNYYIRFNVINYDSLSPKPIQVMYDSVTAIKKGEDYISITSSTVLLYSDTMRLELNKKAKYIYCMNRYSRSYRDGIDPKFELVNIIKQLRELKKGSFVSKVQNNIILSEATCIPNKYNIDKISIDIDELTSQIKKISYFYRKPNVKTLSYYYSWVSVEYMEIKEDNIDFSSLPLKNYVIINGKEIKPAKNFKSYKIVNNLADLYTRDKE
jgi:hypothetical protein